MFISFCKVFIDENTFRVRFAWSKQMHYDATDALRAVIVKMKPLIQSFNVPGRVWRLYNMNILRLSYQSFHQ